MKLEARLRALAAFARRRSFSAAAKELRVSQPAISKHIADLERSLGVKLVERARRDGALTSAGEFVANHVLRAESLLSQADRGAAQFRTSGAGSVSVVASWLTGTYLLPDIIAEFQHAHLGARVSLHLGTAVQAIDLLRSHRADLGIVAGTINAAEIESERILETEVVIVGKRGLAPLQPTRTALESLTWISREEGSAIRGAANVALARLNIVPQRRMELPSYEAVVQALVRGYGIAAISRYVVAPELRAGSLAQIRLPGWNVRNPVSVLRVRDSMVTPTVDRFQAFVRERLRETAKQHGRRRSV